MNRRCGQRCCTSLLYAARERPVPRSEPAADLGALEGIRTPNLLIRSKIRFVQIRPWLSIPPAGTPCDDWAVPGSSALVQIRC